MCFFIADMKRKKCIDYFTLEFLYWGGGSGCISGETQLSSQVSQGLHCIFLGIKFCHQSEMNPSPKPSLTL